MDEYEPTIEDYLNRIRYDDDPDVRRNAVFVLGRHRNLEVVEPLLEALETDEDMEVRLQIVEVLGNFKDERAIAPLTQMIEHESDEMRVQAVRSLGNLENPSALPSIINALGDSHTPVRSQAAEALGNFKAQSAIPVLVNTFLADEDSTVRFYASQSLALIGGTAVAEQLGNALKRTTDIPTQIETVELLAKVGDIQSIDKLSDFAQHEDTNLQATAQWAISVLQKKQGS